jgi:hypothetical protein
MTVGDRPRVTVSNLGKRGRFGNHIFQYMFLRCYAKERGYEVETPDWIGRFLFGADDPPLSDPSRYDEIKQVAFTLDDCAIANAAEDLPWADFNGFFQYRTSYYEPHKPFIRSLFAPSPEVRARLAQAQAAYDALEGPVVGIHARRGDFGYGYFFIAPSQWYLDWLAEAYGGRPVTIFLASDEAERVRDEFEGHRVITAADLSAEMPEAGFYPDFHFMTRCDALAISNSSFSFAAAMLNEKADIFMRPDLARKKLVAFDPWDAVPLLRDAKAEDHGDEFMHPDRQRKSRSRLKRLFGLLRR